MNIKNIIIQAGGLGSRLEALTINKPKCLVSINNLPIIFYIFRQFKGVKFYIIADYKSDVVEKYLNIFAKDVDYHLIRAKNKGTSSGIAESAKMIGKKIPIMLIWSDLILDNSFEFPATDNDYIAISNSFECRWSFVDKKLIKVNSKENGVSGLFIFKNNNLIINAPESGEFVAWLANQDIKFQRMDLFNAKEIGTMNSYFDNVNKNSKCRPFNHISFYDNYIEKNAIDDYGKEVAKKERNWYKFVSDFNYPNIPKIYSYEPLKIERIYGRNVFEYQNFSQTQKVQILKKIVKILNNLHRLDSGIEANKQDLMNNYIEKTFERISLVKDLIPFANQKEIIINNRSYKNIFFVKDFVIDEIKKYFPSKFYIIHGDSTFSNIMLRNQDVEPILIDPRGYFGNSNIYGDVDYDFAKLYYSIIGNYDQFNNRNFSLEIRENNVFLHINSNNWSQLEDIFFEECGSDIKKIKLIHALIWLSLCTYTWDDYDSICASFYNGIIYLNDIL